MRKRNAFHRLRIRFAVALIAGSGAITAPDAGAADVFKGRELYERHCVQCHGANGRGVLPNTPDFTRGQGLMKPDSALVELLRTGRGAMPAFRGVLRDQEMRDVIAHLRTLF